MTNSSSSEGANAESTERNDEFGNDESRRLSTSRSAPTAGASGAGRGRNGRFEAGQAEAERFWAKVDRTSGCGLWRGRVDADGYGRFDRSDGSQVGAHRFAWELEHGPLGPGLTLDHLIGPGEPCTSTRCVRPDHLEPVTNTENLRRRHARRRQRQEER